MNYTLALIVFGAYLLIHNELILHNGKLKKDFRVVTWRCFAGGVIIAVGVFLW